MEQQRDSNSQRAAQEGQPRSSTSYLTQARLRRLVWQNSEHGSGPIYIDWNPYNTSPGYLERVVREYTAEIYWRTRFTAHYCPSTNSALGDHLYLILSILTMRIRNGTLRDIHDQPYISVYQNPPQSSNASHEHPSTLQPPPVAWQTSEVAPTMAPTSEPSALNITLSDLQHYLRQQRGHDDALPTYNEAVQLHGASPPSNMFQYLEEENEQAAAPNSLMVVLRMPMPPHYAVNDPYPPLRVVRRPAPVYTSDDEDSDDDDDDSDSSTSSSDESSDEDESDTSEQVLASSPSHPAASSPADPLAQNPAVTGTIANPTTASREPIPYYGSSSVTYPLAQPTPITRRALSYWEEQFVHRYGAMNLGEQNTMWSHPNTANNTYHRYRPATGPIPWYGRTSDEVNASFYTPNYYNCLGDIDDNEDEE